DSRCQTVLLGEHDVAVLRLCWPENPKVIAPADLATLTLELRNEGSETVEFIGSVLVLYGRLLNEDGVEVRSPVAGVGRRRPRVRHVLGPGEVLHVPVVIGVSAEDQRRLTPGRYRVR